MGAFVHATHRERKADQVFSPRRTRAMGETTSGIDQLLAHGRIGHGVTVPGQGLQFLLRRL
jgi:hypothetical protein